MEKQSLDSISPSTAQPTYTTAGTIYNPNSSQPLQPPTRRGRSLKWTSGGAYSDLSLLPRSLLASLQAKSSGRSSPYQPAPYTPLQQNYDRAANPTRHGYFDDMSTQFSLAENEEERDGVIYVVHPNYNNSSHDVDENENDDEDEDEDEDDDGMNNIMMNMTVKSLHNLASYPNPNQKKAQKALLRPVKPRLNRADSVSPSEFHGQSRVLEYVPLRQRGPRKTQSETMAARLRLRDKLPKYEDGERDAGTAPLNGGNWDSSSWPAEIDIGVPRPLTAGPPGQRQYRASTFKSTFKALNTETEVDQRDEEPYAITAQVLQHAGIDDARRELALVQKSYTDVSKVVETAIEGPDIEASSSGKKSPWYESLDTTAASRARLEWGMPSSSTDRSRHNPAYEASVAAYTKKMNELWYTGCKRLCDEEDLGKEYVGVIGDGRPGQNRHAQLKVEEANEMEVADLARPMLEMAMNNLEHRFVALLAEKCARGE